MTSREKFEAWAKDNGISLVYGDCDYVYSPTVWAWKAWQAAETDMAVQLANAESKCRELAAENARAKKIISECREYFIAGVMNRIRPTNEGYLHMICDTFEDETPATDAFLAEVRAQAMDEAVQCVGQLVIGNGGEMAWDLDDGSRMVLKAEKQEA